MMLWRSRYGNSQWGRYQRLLTEYHNAQRAYDALPPSQRLTADGLNLEWRAEVARRLRQGTALGMPQAGDEDPDSDPSVPPVRHRPPVTRPGSQGAQEGRDDP